MRFSDIIGQEATKQTLIQAHKHNHVAHAQLFLGGHGSAALALARAYAQYLNCTQPEENDSCGKCSTCLKYAKIIHPDLHFVFPTAQTVKYKTREEFIKLWREFIIPQPYPDLSSWSALLENKQLNIAVAESRQIIKELGLKSFDAKYKVMIIWLPEFMQAAASNALLKILEEPTEGTLFLLVAASIDMLLPTIISRTQMIRVQDFTEEEIAQYLSNQGITGAKSKQIALLSENNISQALRLISETNDDSHVFLQKWMQNCFKFDFSALVDSSERFAELGKEAQKNVIQYALHIFRDCLAYRVSGRAMIKVDDESAKFIANFSPFLIPNLENLVQFEEVCKNFERALVSIERNASAKMVFTDISIQAAKAFRQK